MKKIILIPDSFKGTMSSSEVCDILRDGILKFYDCEIISIPVADGGEGSVDAFLSSVGGEKYFLDAQNPFCEDIIGFYGRLSDNTAIIEMAAAAGLPLAEGRLNPCKTSTFGVGQLILHALQSGCQRIILGLGGSCTNDAGAGCLAALGVKFFDRQGEEFVPTGDTLCEIDAINTDTLSPLVRSTSIEVMCDIDNPLYGTAGAAYVFAPQKGANGETVEKLDKGLRHFADKVLTQLGIDVRELPGGGAAGGMGAGVTIVGGTLKMGIDTVLDTVHFDELLDGADLVISGEGRIDGQSARGKVVAGVARRTAVKSIPLVAVVGDIGEGSERLYNMGVTAIFSINRVAVDFSVAKTRAKKDLLATCEDIFRLIKGVYI